MGYKVLGFVVWQATKWYLRRRIGGARRRKMALAVVSAAVVAGVVVAGRHAANSE